MAELRQNVDVIVHDDPGMDPAANAVITSYDRHDPTSFIRSELRLGRSQAPRDVRYPSRDLEMSDVATAGAHGPKMHFDVHPIVITLARAGALLRKRS